MDPLALIARLKAAGVTHQQIADALGRSHTVAVQVVQGRRPLKAHEIAPLEKLLADCGAETDEVDRGSYLSVEVLPAYAGMGGGGYAEDKSETALVPRALIEDMLRGRPTDFLLVYTRGDSMEPDFQQGDQLLVDRRDRSPVQPGPFALRIGDGYVVKNVELAREGVRVFPSNPKYSDEVVAVDEIEFIGRPVWVGRLL